MRLTRINVILRHKITLVATRPLAIPRSFDVSHDERRRERGERHLRFVLRAVGRLQDHEGTLPAVADAIGSGGGGEHVS